MIARGTQNVVETCHVTVMGEGWTGQGEAVGVSYRGESAAAMAVTINAIARWADPEVAADALLPPGGACAALDAALWDWRAKRSGRPALDKAGVAEGIQLASTWTVSLDTPDAMAAEAVQAPQGAAALKVKLGGAIAQDRVRIAAIRAACPAATIIVDANGGWQPADYRAILPDLVAARISMIEQPCPLGKESALEGPHPVPICADEAFDTAADFAHLSPVYSMVNVKLDKCGGPTAALRIADEAERRGIGLMAGSMLTTSLGLAPLFVLAGRAQWFDIDASTYLAEDRAPSLQRHGWCFAGPCPDLWG
jgi:L-alanine-DL-glutamate epimerase-like enolase superfamily enzyme